MIFTSKNSGTARNEGLAKRPQHVECAIFARSNAPKVSEGMASTTLGLIAAIPNRAQGVNRVRKPTWNANGIWWIAADAKEL
ncbi:hypothetical protein CGMCC3_g1300 [Colletotrichum fructicola]|nr:uncharacterized protein CGMCC3_g1300 [Colletotrichum fructicola]KAE9583085.1 hypothetical protein CGMCC3_g1300 [Colletotrichum fructicola]